MPIDREHPACPSCRYDLSGLVASWTDRCPLRLTCPECGREWNLADLLAEPTVVLPPRAKSYPAWPIGCLFIALALTLLILIGVITRTR